LSCGVALFALVLRDRPLALELFATRREAETALAQVLRRSCECPLYRLDRCSVSLSPECCNRLCGELVGPTRLGEGLEG
jgi:hypothetical protein